jgi:hypothetical protein
MSLLAIVLAALVAGIFAYANIKWRRAPLVFKAMKYVALFSLLVGIGIGALAMFAVLGPGPAEPTRGASRPTGAVAGRSVEGESTAGIPVSDVHGALFEIALKHMRDRKWQSWSSVAQDCRLGLTDPHSLRCEAAYIYDDPDGIRGEWKERSELVPYGVVIKFCRAGWADKHSKVCVAASRFGSKSG